MVKNMDLDDELDDYDGDGYYEDGGSVGQQGMFYSPICISSASFIQELISCRVK
jgi:hypothetical protein